MQNLRFVKLKQLFKTENGVHVAVYSRFQIYLLPQQTHPVRLPDCVLQQLEILLNQKLGELHHRLLSDEALDVPPDLGRVSEQLEGVHRRFLNKINLRVTRLDVDDSELSCQPADELLQILNELLARGVGRVN